MSQNRVPVYTVAQINQYLKELLEMDPLLQGLLVRGEISNYKFYPKSGYHYFSLKDSSGSLRCVMSQWDGARLRFRPADGMQVLAFGRVSVYPRDGQYQLRCSQLIADGRGDLDQAFEQLRSQLEREGLFDPARKKPLPPCPRRIALVTSPVGDAVRDMIRILGARWPMAEVLVVPTRVQGEHAAQEIARALDQVNRRGGIDLIITGRGGGSREDLWAFNEEPVARAIARSVIPVISAVGHEPDVTIADYVADVRASTPSNAAERAVPDQGHVRHRLEQLSHRLATAQNRRLDNARKDLNRLSGNRMLRDPRELLEDLRIRTDRAMEGLAGAVRALLKDGRGQAGQARLRLDGAVRSVLKDGRSALARAGGALDAMSPLAVLGRGYAIALGNQGVIHSVEQAHTGQEIRVLLSDGALHCQVEGKEESQYAQAKAEF